MLICLSHCFQHNEAEGMGGPGGCAGNLKSEEEMGTSPLSLSGRARWSIFIRAMSILRTLRERFKTTTSLPCLRPFTGSRLHRIGLSLPQSPRTVPPSWKALPASAEMSPSHRPSLITPPSIYSSPLKNPSRKQSPEIYPNASENLVHG